MSYLARIEAAAAHVAKQELEAALDGLLGIWCETRSPAVANAIDRASVLVAAKLPPIKGKTVAARTSAWNDVAIHQRSADVGRLVLVPFPRQMAGLKPVAEALLRWPDDPRIAQELVRLYEQPSISSDGFWPLMLRVRARIVELRDTRVVPRLRTVQAQRGGLYSEWLAQIIEPLAALTLPELDEASLDVLSNLLVTDDRDAARLREQVDAAPDDRELVAVWGDHLGELGDPRGEFIALQLAKETTPPKPPAKKRERELLEQHGVAWAGSLDRFFAAEHRYFARGLFGGGTLLELDDAALEELLADPACAHLRLINTNFAGGERAAKLVTRLPSVRFAGSFYPPGMQILSAAPPNQLVELHVHPDALPDLDPAKFPAVRMFQIHIEGATARWLRESPFVEQLEKIVIDTTNDDVFEALASRGGALRKIELRTNMEPNFVTPGWRVIASRSVAPGPFDRISIEETSSAVNAEPIFIRYKIGRLPDSWPREVEYRGRSGAVPRDMQAQLEAILARWPNLAKATVPWSRSSTSIASADVMIEAQIDARMLDQIHFPIVWEKLAAFGQRYETFNVNHNTTDRPLGKDPVERIAKWINKGLRDTELRGPDNQRCTFGWSTVAPRVTLGAHSLDDFVTWFADMLVTTAANRGSAHGAGMQAPCKLDLGTFPSQPAAGWLVALGPPLMQFLDRALLHALLSDEPRLAGVRAIETPQHFVFRMCERPEQLTAEPFEALQSALRAQLVAGAPAVLGYDFDREVDAIVGPFVARHGFTETKRRPYEREYELEPITLTLQHHPGGNMYGRISFYFVPYMPIDRPHDYSLADPHRRVTSPSEFALQMEILRQTLASLDDWVPWVRGLKKQF